MSVLSFASLTPAEIAFLAESELISIIPRTKLDPISLLGCTTPLLKPPLPADIPLWLALLLKKQARANIIPPPWLSVSSLIEILAYENESQGFAPGPPLDVPHISSQDPIASPPFQSTSTRFADPLKLPYHFLSISHLLLQSAEDDIPESEAVRRLLRDIREARAAKIRKGLDVLSGGDIAVLNGVGGLEVAEQGGFIRGVVDGLRVIGASKESSRRDREREGGGPAGTGTSYDDGSDEEMLG